MNRSTGIILGVLVAFASSVAATGSTPPGLPWVTARKPAKILITNGAFSDVGLGVYSNDDDAASLFQPAAEIASTCTASDGESFNPNTTINITGSHTVDGPTVGNAAIVASRVQSVNRILSADGAAGTPTITATAPVCEIKSDVTRTGTGLVSNSAPVLEVIENDTLGTGSALKITQKATAGDALQVWDTDSKTASVDDQGNASFRDVTASNEINGVVLSTLTTLDLYDPAPSANAISIQAPSGISSWLMILPPNDGNSGDVLTTDGTGTTTWVAPAVGDITAVGSMTSGAAFADASATGDCFGLTAMCGSTSAANIVFTDTTVDTIGFMGARVGIGTTSPGIDSPGVGDALITMLGGSTTNDEGVIELATSAADADTAILGDVIFLSASTTDTEKRSAFIRGWQDGASANNRGGKISFHVQNNGSNTITEAQTIRQSGWIGFGDSAPAVPYEFHNTSASNANTMVAFRDDRTTSTTTPNYMVSFNRQNSDTAAWYLGNDGNDDGVLATNNATLRIGYDSGGTFNEVLRTDTAGLTTAAGDLAVNGGDITTTAATMNLIPSAATALNIGTTSSSAINVGDSTSYTAVSGLRTKVREVSGTAALDGNDKNVICDTSGGAATLTMPSAANTGQELTIVRKGSDANACNISRAGSDTITLTGAGTAQTNINISGGSVDSRTCFADGGTVWYCHTN